MASSLALSRLSNLRRHFDLSNSHSDNKKGLGLIKVSLEVSEAGKWGSSVVALESTIISHGMPYLKNLETAKEVEAIVRDKGAVLATIAILDGVPCVGLSVIELERLANLWNLSSKDSSQRHCICCKWPLGELVQLPLLQPWFAFQSSLQEGLEECTDMVKIETQGICVAAYKTNEFPAFFTETSSCCKVIVYSMH
ncbi:Pseudouridine-5'-phosphate glycosidase [Trema orientale]|uniref:Pseudouridine-5'-phosphate glycosidase n=1 Tax=Trema orientale TaxID=63057 RepID=A0A2P5FIN1_TREOI|nr:Pseudouridine-5'-phosphate glycosidase [Trema orientale]